MHHSRWRKKIKERERERRKKVVEETLKKLNVTSVHASYPSTVVENDYLHCFFSASFNEPICHIDLSIFIRQLHILWFFCCKSLIEHVQMNPVYDLSGCNEECKLFCKKFLPLSFISKRKNKNWLFLSYYKKVKRQKKTVLLHRICTDKGKRCLSRRWSLCNVQHRASSSC